MMAILCGIEAGDDVLDRGVHGVTCMRSDEGTLDGYAQ